MLDLRPRTLESGVNVLDILVRGKRTKVHLEFHVGGDRAWVPGQGYVGPAMEPAVAVVDRRGSRPGQVRFRFISGPNLLNDLALDLLNRFT